MVVSWEWCQMVCEIYEWLLLYLLVLFERELVLDMKNWVNLLVFLWIVCLRLSSFRCREMQLDERIRLQCCIFFCCMRLVEFFSCIVVVFFIDN